MDVKAIREAYGMSKGDLVKALSCAPLTVTRWERGEHPTGIHRAVLRAMEAAARETDEETRRVHGAVLTTLGVGGFLARGIRKLVAERNCGKG